MRFKGFIALAVSVGLGFLLALTVVAQEPAGSNLGTTSSRVGPPGPTTDVAHFTPTAAVYLPFVAQNYDPFRLYFDDFSDPNSGWPFVDRTDIKYSYQAGEYEILLRNANWWGAAAAPIGNIADYSVEADMHSQIGSTNSYGLIFGLGDWDHFYTFLVYPDGQYYSIWRHDPDWVTLVDWTQSPHVNPPGAANHLKVERTGSRIVVYVNGHLLATVRDGTYTGSLRVGLYAQTEADAPGAVRFDNFEVRQPATAAVLTGIQALSGDEKPAAGGTNSVAQPHREAGAARVMTPAARLVLSMVEG